MSDPIWYYAKDDQQHGPVTPAQLKSLSNSGKLLPTDLVWKEGMADWAPASDVKGLFTFVPTPPPPPAETSSPAPVSETAQPNGSDVTVMPPTVPTPSTPQLPMETTPVAPAAKTTPVAASGASQPTVPVPKVASTEASVSARVASAAHQRRLGLGRPLVYGGLLLVMLARGCDSLADSYAARLAASADVVEAQFNDAWAARRAPLEAQRDAMLANAERNIDDNIRLENIETQLNTLNAEMQKEFAAKQQEWATLKASARDAQAGTRQAALWRQLVFLPAALVFVVGLMVVSASADGPERWLCLVMLAIVVYSLFVGGAAW